jgi:cellulose synthase/poly-beta-1,6-N-acetylglucosamine synthase-like glycosyltransferase
VDDFVIPLQARQRTGCEIVYDRNAVACEETPERIRSEFRRRTRIGAGGFQTIGLLHGLLHPKHGWICLTFWSHKVLRWLCPFFLITAFVANAFLASQLIFLALLLVQIGFYAVSGAAAWLPARPRSLRFLRLGTMFTSMNLALLFGFFRWLRGSQKAAWTRTARSAEFATIVEQPIAAAS